MLGYDQVTTGAVNGVARRKLQLTNLLSVARLHDAVRKHDSSLCPPNFLDIGPESNLLWSRFYGADIRWQEAILVAISSAVARQEPLNRGIKATFFLRLPTNSHRIFMRSNTHR